MEALSTGKARGTPALCHVSKSPPDISVHSRGTCFSWTASNFTPRIDSHQDGTWDSPLGKPRGKASRVSHRSFDRGEGKHDTAATTPEKSARSCPYSSRGPTSLWRVKKYHMIHVSMERSPQVPATNAHKVLGTSNDGSGIMRGPRATSMGTDFS